MMDIKNRTGQVRLSVPVTEKAIYRKELMKQEFILLGFSTDEIIDFGKGDYIDTGYGRFELLEPAFPAGNASTGGYDYELRFDSPLARWANFKLFYNRKGNKESNWSMTHLSQYFMEVVIANLKELNFSYNGKPYTFEIDHDYLSNVSKPLTFDGTSIFDALTRIAEAWEAEWWVEEHIIKLGRCEQKDLPAVELDSVAVSSFSRSQSNSDYATRIYAFGSERNIPANYRVDESEVAVDGVVRKRLMLPSGTPYVDAMENMAPEDIVEAVVLFDDIYPRTAGKIDKVDPVVEEINDDEGNPTGKTQTFYLITDSSLKNFSEKYIIPGQELRVVFESGLLAGMDFGVELEGSDDNGTVFRITPNTDYIVSLPNETLKPTVNSTYVLHGFDTSFVDDSLLSLAEQELLARAEAYVKKSSIDPSVYTCVMNPVRAAGYVDDVYHPDKEIDLRIGQKVTLVNSSYFPEGHSSRIYGFEKRLDNKFSCTYTVGENAEYSRLGKLEGKIQNISYKDVTYSQSGGGNIYLIRSIDDTIATDYNAFSALRTQKEFKKQSDSSDNRYLFKDRPDQTDFLLGMNDGATFGNYLGGTLGSGAMIDKDGIGEMTGLKLREFLEVPELRFNRIDVVSGELWNSIAFGLIESVDEQNRIVTLHLEEGELSGLHVNDFCRGIFHNLTGNAEQPGKDSSGFDTLVGFSTAYFTPVEIIDNARFKYELKPGTTVHPSPSMKFAVYGNALDKDRQSSAYSTRNYQRYLRNVNTWKINPGKHVSMQLGDLSGLVINGESLAEGSIYLNNVYFGGNVWNVPGLDNNLKGQDAYSVTLSTYSAVYNTKDGLTEQVDIVTGDKNVVTGMDQVVAQNFCISTKIQVSKGAAPLRYSTVIGEGKYLVTSVGTGCTYTVTDSLVVVHGVTEEKAEVKLEINCEGVAVYEQVFTIVRVIDGMDGTDVEWIFQRTETEDAKPVRPVVSENVADFVPEGWTDDPVGPDITNQFEWSCKRERVNGIWEEFSEVYLWSRWGKDGTSTEYIYALSKNYVPPAITNSQDDGHVPMEWNSAPLSVTEVYKILWVSQRVKKDGRWSNFSNPSIYAKWAEDGKDGDPGKDGNATYMVYRRSETQPDTPKAGSMPPSGWSLDPPSGTHPLWMSDAVFRGDYSLYRSWSVPVRISGTDGQDGATGPSLTFRKKYDASKIYTGAEQHVDAVYTEENGVKIFWMAKTSAGSFSNKYPSTGSVYWERFQGQFESIATGLALIEEANIAGWLFSDLVIKSQGNNVIIDGNADDHPRIALGASYENRDYAPARLYDDGSVYFEKGEFGGSLTGVSGSFKTLNCVNNSGETVGGINFGSDGKMWFSGDLYNQGYNNSKNRGYRFYSADIWCRSGFGSSYNNAMLINGSTGYYCLKGIRSDRDGYVSVSLTSKVDTGNNSYYQIPLYGASGDAAGFPVDLVVVTGSSSMRYELIGSVGKSVTIANGNDQNNSVWIYSNGYVINLKGGCMCDFVNIGYYNLSPSVSSTKVGAGWMYKGYQDNDWS